MSATLLNDFRETQEEIAEERNPLTARMSERKWLLGLATLAAATVGVSLCYLAKPKYEARSVLLLPVDAGAASAAAGLLGGGGPNPIDVLRGVATSYPAQSRVQKRFGMKEKEYRELLKVSGDADSNQITLSVTDDRKAMALGILDETIAALDDLNRDLGFSAASRQASYLTDAIAQKQAKLEVSRRRLAEFQKGMKAPSNPNDPSSLVDLAQQLQKAEIELAALQREGETMKREAVRQGAAALNVGTALPASEKWRTRVVEAEYQYNLVAGEYGPQNPEVLAAKHDLDVTRAAAKREIQGNVAAVQSSVDPALAQNIVKREALAWTVAALKKVVAQAPEEAMRVNALIQNVKEQETILGELKKRYEEAKIDAQVDKVRFSVLEKPHLSEEPTNKSYPRQAALFGALGFLGALIVPTRKKR